MACLKSIASSFFAAVFTRALSVGLNDDSATKLLTRQQNTSIAYTKHNEAKLHNIRTDENKAEKNILQVFFQYVVEAFDRIFGVKRLKCTS